MHFDKSLSENRLIYCGQALSSVSLEVFDEAENFLRGIEDFWNHVIINRAGPVGWKYTTFKNRPCTD